MEAFRRAVGGGPEVGHSGPDSGTDCGSGRLVFEVCQQPCEDKEERQIEMELRWGLLHTQMFVTLCFPTHLVLLIALWWTKCVPTSQRDRMVHIFVLCYVDSLPYVWIVFMSSLSPMSWFFSTLQLSFFAGLIVCSSGYTCCEVTGMAQHEKPLVLHIEVTGHMKNRLFLRYSRPI